MSGVSDLASITQVPGPADSTVIAAGSPSDDSAAGASTVTRAR